MTAKSPNGSKWQVRKCRDCPQFYRAPCRLWFTMSPAGGVMFHPSYAAACDYVAEQQRRPQSWADAAERQAWMSACEEDDAVPVDGAVWVGSREFQWPQVKRYGEPEGAR